jgi:hypothetical protein
MEEGTNTQATLYQRGTVWIVNTSIWTGADKLQADDLGKESEDIPDIVRLGNKYMIPHEWRLKLQTPRGKIAGLMTRIGRSFFINGAYFVPDSKLLLAKEGIE